MHVELHDTFEGLQWAAKSEKNARVRDRIPGVILARDERTAPEIADILGARRRAVQQWIKSYNHNGLKDLFDKANMRLANSMSASRSSSHASLSCSLEIVRPTT